MFEEFSSFFTGKSAPEGYKAVKEEVSKKKDSDKGSYEPPSFESLGVDYKQPERPKDVEQPTNSLGNGERGFSGRFESGRAGSNGHANAETAKKQLSQTRYLN